MQAGVRLQHRLRLVSVWPDAEISPVKGSAAPRGLCAVVGGQRAGYVNGGYRRAAGDLETVSKLPD